MSKHTPGQFEHRHYRGHTIELIEAMGWSDVYQTVVPNGFRITVDGPNFSCNQQTYLNDTRWVDQAIDDAITKATGGKV